MRVGQYDGEFITAITSGNIKFTGASADLRGGVQDNGIAGAMADVTAQFAPLGSAIAGLDRVTPDALPLPLTGPTTNIYQGSSTSITMPVYTNQSPAVLQQSYAVMQALVAL